MTEHGQLKRGQLIGVGQHREIGNARGARVANVGSAQYTIDESACVKTRNAIMPFLRTNDLDGDPPP